MLYPHMPHSMSNELCLSLFGIWDQQLTLKLSRDTTEAFKDDEAHNGFTGNFDEMEMFGYRGGIGTFHWLLRIPANGPLKNGPC